MSAVARLAVVWNGPSMKGDMTVSSLKIDHFPGVHLEVPKGMGQNESKPLKFAKGEKTFGKGQLSPECLRHMTISALVYDKLGVRVRTLDERLALAADDLGEAQGWKIAIVDSPTQFEKGGTYTLEISWKSGLEFEGRITTRKPLSDLLKTLHAEGKKPPMDAAIEKFVDSLPHLVWDGFLAKAKPLYDKLAGPDVDRAAVAREYIDLCREIHLCFLASKFVS